MKGIHLIFALLFFSSICFGETTDWEKWQKKHNGQKNYFPKYGQSAKTVEEQLADNEFISTILSSGLTEKTGSNDLSSKAWKFFQNGDYEMAMLRFNQSWLLDSTNYSTMWGFGALLGVLGNSTESIKYLKDAYTLNSKNKRLLIDISTAYSKLFFQNNDKESLQTGLPYLLEYIEYDKSSEFALYNAAKLYFLLEDYENSWLYINKCQELGGKTIDPQFIKELKKMMKNPY